MTDQQAAAVNTEERPEDAARRFAGRLLAIEALHNTQQTSFVDDDGAEHPVTVCAECSASGGMPVAWPCRTWRIARGVPA